MKKSGFFLALFLGLFLTFVFSSPHPAMAQSGCYFTDQDDYICDNFTPTTTTTPPTGTAPPPPPPPTATKPTPKPSTPCKAGSDPYEDFKKHLMVREGYRNVVYKDSLGKPTVGVGHLVVPGDNLKVGDKISDAQVAAFLDKDAKGAWSAAQAQAAEAGITDTCFIIALGSVNYQLGTGWRKKFPSTWNLIKSGKYLEAANALNGTLWAKQTPVRVQDFQKALRDLDAKKKAGGP